MTSHVYRLFDEAGELLYIGMTSNFEQRIRFHLEPVSDRQARLPGADEIKARYHHHTLEPYPNEFVARKAERKAIKAEAPLLNRFHNPTRWQRAYHRGPYVPVT